MPSWRMVDVVPSTGSDTPFPLRDGEVVMRGYGVRATEKLHTASVRTEVLSWLGVTTHEEVDVDATLFLTNQRIVIFWGQSVEVPLAAVTSAVLERESSDSELPYTLHIESRNGISQPQMLAQGEIQGDVWGFERFGFGDMSGHYLHCKLDDGAGATAAREFMALVIAMRSGLLLEEDADGSRPDEEDVLPMDFAPGETLVGMYDLTSSTKLYLTDRRTVLTQETVERKRTIRKVSEIPLEELEWLGWRFPPGWQHGQEAHFYLVHHGWHLMDVPEADFRGNPLLHYDSPANRLQSPHTLVASDVAGHLSRELGALVAASVSVADWADPLLDFPEFNTRLGHGEAVLLKREWVSPFGDRNQIVVTSRRIVAQRISRPDRTSMRWDMLRQQGMRPYVLAAGSNVSLLVITPRNSLPERELRDRARSMSSVFSALEAVDAEHPPIVLAMAPGDVGTYAEELVQVLSRPIEADEIPASAAARMPAADAVVSSCDVSEGRLVLTQQRLLLARAGGDALNIANEIWSVPLQDVHELLHYASGGDQILIPVIDNPVPRSAAERAGLGLDGTKRFPELHLAGAGKEEFAASIGAQIEACKLGMSPTPQSGWDMSAASGPEPPLQGLSDERMVRSYVAGGGTNVWCTNRRLIVGAGTPAGRRCVVAYPLDTVGAIEEREDVIPWGNPPSMIGLLMIGAGALLLSSWLVGIIALLAAVGLIGAQISKSQFSKRTYRSLIIHTETRGYDVSEPRRSFAQNTPAQRIPLGAPRPRSWLRRLTGRLLVAEEIVVQDKSAGSLWHELPALVFDLRRRGDLAVEEWAGRIVESEGDGGDVQGVWLATGEEERHTWDFRMSGVGSSFSLTDRRLVGTRRVTHGGWTNEVRWHLSVDAQLTVRSGHYYAARVNWLSGRANAYVFTPYPSVVATCPALPAAEATRPSKQDLDPNNLHVPYKKKRAALARRHRYVQPMDPYFAAFVLPWDEGADGVAAECRTLVLEESTGAPLQE